MRTAEQILIQCHEDFKLKFKNPYTTDDIKEQIYIKAINEARKEAIKECAKKVKIQIYADLQGGPTYKLDKPIIDIDSVLNLIHELK